MEKEIKKSKERIVVLNTEQIQEYLFNIVQDAQALGSVVQIVNIVPSLTIDQDGQLQALACGPKDVICPK